MQKKISLAFSLVHPRRVYQEMARRGIVSQEAADQASRRATIDAVLTDDELVEAGLRPATVAKAILAATGSHAGLAPTTVYGTPWMSFWPRSGRPGWHFWAMSPGHTRMLTSQNASD